MKRLTMVVIGALVLASPILHAQETGVFQFEAAEISKVLEAYRAMTGARLVIASNVAKVPRKVTLKSEGPTTTTQAAKAIEHALVEQAGVIVTGLPDGRVSVTFNDALKVSNP